MPFINVKTNAQVDKEKELAVKSALGQAITAIPGKSEGWLMIDIEQGRNMYFKGTDEPCAMVSVSIYGSASSSAYDDLTGRIDDILSGTLGIDKSRIYTAYFPTSDWGWNGSNF
ncbi:MAG: hypothetical protein IJ696_00120 [Ruminococcus sp.]|nr:hypothetical protein [Ruminococcus sp.]